MQTSEMKKHLENNDYQNVRQLDDGTWVGTSELLFTTALFIGLHYLTWDTRYCFEDRNKAISELKLLKQKYDIPSGYIAKRPKE